VARHIVNININTNANVGTSAAAQADCCFKFCHNTNDFPFLCCYNIMGGSGKIFLKADALYLASLFIKLFIFDKFSRIFLVSATMVWIEMQNYFHSGSFWNIAQTTKRGWINPIIFCIIP